MNTESLRIALIASNRFPIREPFAGGLEAHIWHLARALTGAGHRVTLFAGEGSDPGLHASLLDVHAFEPSAAARADESMVSETFLADHHAYLSLMLQLAGPLSGGRFDVIHNHSLHYLPVAMAHTLGTPVVCTLHTPPHAVDRIRAGSTRRLPCHVRCGESSHRRGVASRTRDTGHRHPQRCEPGGGWPRGPGGTD